jgi:hypothetical protein
MLGTEGALEQLSLWDPSGDGSISRHEMVGILLEMFQDREGKQNSNFFLFCV